jgi:ABC-type phosphate transport system ATPase subunit
MIVTHKCSRPPGIRLSGFFLNGHLVEFNETEELFVNPRDKRTEDLHYRTVRLKGGGNIMSMTICQ